MITGICLAFSNALILSFSLRRLSIVGRFNATRAFRLRMDAGHPESVVASAIAVHLQRAVFAAGGGKSQKWGMHGEMGLN